MRRWGRWVVVGLFLGGTLHAADPEDAAAPGQAVPKQALPDLSAQPAAAGADTGSDTGDGTGVDKGLPALRNSGYIHLGLGARWFPNANTSQLLFDPIFESYSSGSGLGTGLPSLDVAAGFQSSAVLGLEIGLEAFPDFSAYAMPTLRLASPGLSERPLLHTLGFQVGWMSMSNATNGGFNGGYYSSSYDYNAQDFTTYAVCYRVEQMLTTRLSLGLELAYHFGATDVSYVDYSRFPYNTVHEHLDYSGPSLKLILATWPGAPFWTAQDQAGADAVQTRRQRRIDARLARYEALRGRDDSAPDYDSAADAKDAGDKAMDAGRFKAAESAYQQATLLAPGDTKAWRGLANAEYAEGKHARAYTHYKEALRLDPKDAELRDFVEKLRVRLRQDLDLN
jgi:hypothetical protein